MIFWITRFSRTPSRACRLHRGRLISRAAKVFLPTLTFFAFCKKAFPEISDQTVARMVAGIDVIMYRPDDELRDPHNTLYRDVIAQAR